ncbi:biotin transporter BioY [Clostridium aciditolerans]|uniref:Biotin transporter n=1 Tax=Clostridium aciditolerans TaxID=339861 RepID=A0A934M2W3_9CLOT|nr:biotin transporter BioY [Clostridium aciditolerans]MBI6872370.1 biotin transporter BioY [Clostridium aciditolerans]
MSKKLKAKDIVYSALFATLTAVLGYITIPLPFSPIAITGQSLAVMLAGCVLTPIQAALSMLTFLFMGIIGLPVFSGGRTGIGVIVGKSGGYLIGYLVGAVIISILVRKSKSKITMFLACLFGGIIVVHILGAAWLGYVTGMGIEKAIMVGSVPFLPGDLLKAVAAVVIGVRLNKNIRSYAHA